MIIDLSVKLNEHMPVYPGDPATALETVATTESDGYMMHRVSLGTHAGTHIDAPHHMIAGGKTLDQFPVERYIGRGRLMRGFNLQAMRQADIQSGDIVLFHTGVGSRYRESRYFEEFPAMPEEIARFLVERAVSMVGTDTCGPDTAEGFPVHKILLGGEVLIIENLTNLEQLIDREFRVYALPIHLDLDGAPARVVAEVFGNLRVRP